jgi:hypothetical protein
MVQAVEAWMIADREAIRDYFGDGFNENALPKRRNPEEIPKDDLKDALDQAGRNSKTRGYHEIVDGTRIIERLDPVVVRSKCPSCRRLFDVICDHLGVQRLP